MYISWFSPIVYDGCCLLSVLASAASLLLFERQLRAIFTRTQGPSLETFVMSTLAHPPRAIGFHAHSKFTV